MIVIRCALEHFFLVLMHLTAVMVEFNMKLVWVTRYEMLENQKNECVMVCGTSLWNISTFQWPQVWVRRTRELSKTHFYEQSTRLMVENVDHIECFSRIIVFCIVVSKNSTDRWLLAGEVFSIRSLNPKTPQDNRLPSALFGYELWV